MSSDKRKPTSWKNPGAAGSNGPAPSQKREWHPATTKAAKSGGPRRRSILWPALAGAVLLGLIVAAALLLRPARLPRLVYLSNDNSNTVSTPPNIAGSQASGRLAQWAGEGDGRPHVAAAPANPVVGDDWARGLDDGKEDSVVVALYVHGGVDAAGEPFLWLVPDRAPEPTDKQKVRVSSIIARLGQLPEKKRKLLILDATQVPVSYGHGQLHNDFARALKKLDAQIAQVPNLVVLCSSDEDQRSWISEEWQESIFAHLLLEGAKGAACVDRVTVDKLFEYLKREVPAWTLANRGESQTPILLPSGSGMELAKKIDFSSVTAKSYKAPDVLKAPGNGFSAGVLSGSWERCARLSSSHPEAVAPHLWRRHLDTLLRVEQMYRTGLDSATVQAKLDQLAKGEYELMGKPWPDLTSLGNALPMPVALAAEPVKNPLDLARFQALWEDPQNDWPVLKQSVEAQGEVAVTRLRLDVCALLIDYLIREDQPKYLVKAAQLLDVVFGPSPAPVEAHLIRLWARDLDAGKAPPWLALETQRLSEQAALVGGAGAKEFAASEQVYPWIKDAVTAADTERLRGLDLLLSNVAADWTKSQERLGSAKTQYGEILKRAKQVREALAERSSALAELPYYGRWVAGLRDEFDSTESQKLLEQVERTAEAMHALSSMIEEANPDRLGEMNAKTAAVRDGMKQMRDKFFAFIATLNGDVLISRWHHLDNALQVPFIPAKRRAELLGYLRSISQDLNVKWQDVEKRMAAKSGANPRDAAQRHGRVALALLGSAWVNDLQTRDESGGTVKASYDDLKQLVLAPKPEWWLSLGDAGDQIGRHWRALANRIDEITEKAARDPLDKALSKLAHADTLSRIADSTCAFGKDHDPIVDHRRYRLHDFLLNQARRTIDAGWAAVELAAPRHYTEITGERFVNDAERLILMGAGANPSPGDRSRLLALVNPVRHALKMSPFAVVPSELTVDLTDQQRSFRWSFTVRRPAGQTPGYPVLRVHSGGPARAPDPTVRRPLLEFVRDNAPQIEQTLDVEIDTKSVATGQGSVTAELWHRGHRIVATTRVELNREPSSIWAHHPPELDPGFAVQATPGQRSGAVAIVLDWSRSMGPESKDANGKTRYDRALAALGEVLESLPVDTHVSISLFPGPAGGYSQLVERPTPRDFKSNPEQLRQILKKLDAMQPDGINTPGARAIVRAADDGFPANFVGYQTMVVLTDGEDNVDYRNAGNVVKEALTGKNIALKMIFFQEQDNGAEFENARKQFEAIESMDPPGQIVGAKDQKALITNLVDAMRPRVRTFKRNGDQLERIAAEERRGLPVMLKGSNLQDWSRPLPPGPYTLKAVGVEGKIRLERGDRLMLELVRVDRQIVFRPHLHIPDAIPDDNRKLIATSKDGQNIRAGLGECKLVKRDDGGYDLDLFVFVERERKPEELQVTYPHFLWIDVGTQNDMQEPALITRLDNELYYPAPAYHVRVAKWPALPGQESVRRSPSRPAITVYSRSGLPGQSVLRTRDTRKSLGENFEGEAKAFTLDGKKVKVDSIRFEGDYLYLQVSHPPGEPVVFVRTEELKDDPRLSLKEEHRFYAKAGKYTARFGPLSDDEKKRAFTLDFYSMADLKRDASKVELRPNVAPDVSDLLGQDVPVPVKLEK